MVEEKQEFLPTERHTVVIPKNLKRQLRGAPIKKILILWRKFTIPCTYSDRLTPATLIEDIGKSPWATPEALVKATLTPPTIPLGTMHLDTPLSLQGIVKGDTLTMLVRHAKIHDPYDVQHLVAYRAEDTIQYFLTALREISSIPTLSEIVICHKGLRLDPASRFQDCNLPHEPTLHVRFSSHLDAHPRNEPEQPEPVGEADDSAADPTNTSSPKDRCRGTQQETQDTGKARGDMGMTLSMSPSQAFVQDPMGKTHVLLFNPQDSIAKNLMRHSSQLHLPPIMELYILSGSHIIQADRTGTENGLHQEPHLKILLRCRGGMRGGPRGSPQGGSSGKGRIHRSPEGSDRQMGRSYVNEDRSNHTTPPERGGQGRGRGNLPIDPRRPTIVHTAVQEPIDANRLNASLKATQETHCNMMILLCRQSWEESEMIIGHGVTPITAD